MLANSSAYTGLFFGTPFLYKGLNKQMPRIILILLALSVAASQGISHEVCVQIRLVRVTYFPPDPGIVPSRYLDL